MTGACEGKIALVVGGTRGIGRAAAMALAAAGAKVVVSGRSIDTAKAAADAIGGEAHPIAFDVSAPEASAAAVREVVQRFGALDILVANAGVNPYWTRSENLTPAIWDEVMQVNLRGTFFAVQAAGRQMLQQGRGSIVSVSSVTSTVGVVRGLPYVATKGGIDAMTRSLSVEWAPRGVRVNAVAPGYVETDLTHGMRDNPGLSASLLSTVPMGRFATPEEIGGAIVFLASDVASYITGQVIVVDGGFAAGRGLPPSQKS